MLARIDSRKSSEHTVSGVDGATNTLRNNFLLGDRVEDKHAQHSNSICKIILQAGWVGEQATYIKLLIATLFLMAKKWNNLNV